MEKRDTSNKLIVAAVAFCEIFCNHTTFYSHKTISYFYKIKTRWTLEILKNHKTIDPWNSHCIN